jgi:hypothetical protein
MRKPFDELLDEITEVRRTVAILRALVETTQDREKE